MKLSYKILTSLLFLSLVACKSEEPFSEDIPDGTGRILTSSLNIEVKEDTPSVRSATVPVPADFTVAFCKEDTPYEALYSFEYAEMPEVVTLPVGNYIVKAYYGDDNITAAFDAPSYYGESAVISIQDGMIFDLKDPIVCTLYNVRVAVSFDSELLKVIEDDAVVTVKMGESGELDFKLNTEKDGFFKFIDNSTTLVATFSGTVEGTKITEIKTYSNVKRGYFYNITFKLRNVETGAEDPGGVTGNGSLFVDATVTFHDQSGNGGQNLEPDREEYIEDDRYPGNSGEDNQPEQPNQPDQPEESGVPLLLSDDVNLSIVTDISNWPEGKKLAVKIVSPTKITKFICTIDSSILTPSELEGISLKSELDLINDTSLFDVLHNFGFPVGDEVTNPQTKDEKGNFVVIFDITNFVEMLNALDSGYHNFIFDVENEAGGMDKANNTLKLKN